jgi:hypothetical protein
MASRISIEQSKTGLSVPKVDNVYLHSTLDPIKEAEAFAKTQITRTEKTNAILILGLGFGYHIQELQRLLSANDRKIRIAVIEPNRDLVELYLQNINAKPSFDIIANEDVIALYQEKAFVEILKLKPLIISHNNSFNSNKNFFSTLLSYRASHQVLDYVDRIDDDSFKNYLREQASESDTLQNIIDRVSNTRNISRNEKLLLAFAQTIGKQARNGEAAQ